MKERVEKYQSNLAQVRQQKAKLLEEIRQLEVLEIKLTGALECLADMEQEPSEEVPSE